MDSTGTGGDSEALEGSQPRYSDLLDTTTNASPYIHRHGGIHRGGRAGTSVFVPKAFGKRFARVT